MENEWHRLLYEKPVVTFYNPCFYPRIDKNGVVNIHHPIPPFPVRVLVSVGREAPWMR